MKINIKILIHLVIITVFSFAFSNAIAGKLYKWIDENGIIYFSNRIPEQLDPKDLIQEETLKEIPTGKPSEDFKPVQRTKTSGFVERSGHWQGCNPDCHCDRYSSRDPGNLAVLIFVYG